MSASIPFHGDAHGVPRPRVNDSAAELGAVTAELGRCYEELSLLYRFSARMAINQPPEACVEHVCRDLRRALKLDWTTVFFDKDAGPNRWAGTFFCDGDVGLPEHRACTLVASLAEHCHATAAGTVLTVDDLEALADDGHVELPAHVRPMLFVPIQHDTNLLGVFVAGSHHTPRRIASSDLKICASLINSLSVFLRNTQLYEESQELFTGSLHALVAAIDAKDAYTHGHSKRVALVSRLLARAAGLDEKFQERAYLAGLVHDVGKIGVPEAVLTKPGKLTDAEFDEIKKHPQIGANILRDVRQMAPLVPGVLFHHERWDGRGYPHGLKGDQTPMLARVIGLADAFDAMSSTRTYRAHLTPGQVLDEIASNAGTQFDPELAEAFLAMDTEPYRRLLKHQSRSEPRQRKSA